MPEKNFGFKLDFVSSLWIKNQKRSCLYANKLLLNEVLPLSYKDMQHYIFLNPIDIELTMQKYSREPEVFYH